MNNNNNKHPPYRKRLIRKDLILFLVIGLALLKQITSEWLKDDNLIIWKDLVNEIY